MRKNPSNVLKNYKILDTTPEEIFDDLSRLAGHLCKVPISLVGLLDGDRLWYKSRQDWPASEDPLKDTFCNEILEHKDVLVVTDATKDRHHKEHPLWTRHPDIRFLAGTPLVNPRGQAVGVLIVMDRQPHRLSPEQREGLRTLGHQVVTQLELRLHVNELMLEIHNHKRTERELRIAEHKYHSIFEHVVEGIFQTTVDGRYISANPMLARIYGYDSPEALIADLQDIGGQLYLEEGRREEFLRRINEDGILSEFESQVRRKDGRVIWISENARVVRDDKTGQVMYYEGTTVDITRRKQAQEHLRASELRFRSIWEKSADGMRLTDSGGIIRTVNPSFCRIVGMKEEDLLGHHFTVIYPPEQVKGKMLKYRQRFEKLRVDNQLERHVAFRNGRRVHVEISNSFLNLDSDDPLLLCIFRDISQRKEAESALRESELLHHSLVECLPQNIFRKDLDHRFSFANGNFCRSLGRRKEEILGRTDHDFFPSELADKYRRDDQHIIESGETFEAVEEYLTSDNTKAFVHVVKTPLFNTHGDVIGIQGIFWDVTTQKETEFQLAHERDLLKALLENIPDRIYFKDDQSRFLKISVALARKFGLERPEDAEGKSDFDFFTYDHARPAFEDEKRIMEHDRPMIGKTEREIWPDGSISWALTTKMPLKNTEGKIIGTFGVSKDITEIKEAEQALAEARDAALESSRLKSEFLAMMSHEIRTPMNGILGMTGLLLDTQLDRAQQDFARTVQFSANALLEIINDILDFSKIEAGKLVLEEIPCAPIEVIENTIDLLAERAQSKGLELSSLIEDNVPASVVGDPGRLRQILLNLLGNAIKFTDHGEVTLRARMVEKDSGKPLRLRIEIKDTGIGIEEKVRTRIFEAFTQADGSTTRRFGGTGLGLAICRQLVELMDGEINVDSELGKGSTFWFEIDLKPDPECPAQPWKQVIQPLQGKRALIVDDNATNRENLQYQLHSWGMSEACADTPEAGLELMRQSLAAGTPFDVALLDMQMPGQDGLGLARSIRALPGAQSMPLVILTSLGHRFSSDELSSMGIDHYLVKPVHKDRLMDALVRSLSSHSVQQESGERRKSAPSAITSAGNERLTQARVLLAEDNIVNQKVTLLQLHRMGLQADVANNGLEAVRHLERQPYDVVLMDCHMPQMDGFEATRIIRGKEEGDPAWKDRTPAYIIASTANALEGDREQCIAAGMDDYISKPIEVDHLFRALNRWLDRALPLSGDLDHDTSDSPPPKPSVTAPNMDLAADLDPCICAETLFNSSVLDGLRAIRVEGAPDPVAELVDLFLADSPPRLQTILDGLTEQNHTVVFQAAHALKGSSSNLGTRRLAALAREIETAAKGEDWDTLRRLSPHLEKVFEETRQRLEQEK